MMGVAVAMLATSTPYAQGRTRWVNPYNQGKDAYKDAKYEDAIRLMKEAIGFDPNPAPQKPTSETLLKIDYFPQLYLGAAQVKMGLWNEAEANLDRAARDASRMDRNHQQLLSTARAELTAKRPRPTPVDPPTPTRGDPAPPPPPPPPPVGPTPFERDAETAKGHVTGRRFGEALVLIERLRTQNQSDFNRLGLGAARDAAAKGRSDELVKDGNDALNAGRLADARRRFSEADGVLPGAGAAGLRDVTTRENEYRAAVNAGQQAQGRGDWPAVIEQFEKARTLHPDQFRTEGLEAVLTGAIRSRDNANASAAAARDSANLLTEGKQLLARRQYVEAEARFQRALDRDNSNTEAKDLLNGLQQFSAFAAEAKTLQQQNKLAEAAGPLGRAKALDSARFRADADLMALDRAIAAVPRADSVRAGLVYCLEGESAQAIAILAPIARNSQALERGLRAHVHAWLGVSYATESLLGGSDEQRREALQQALSQFRTALQIQPEYALSESLVSPKVRAIWQQAKGR